MGKFDKIKKDIKKKKRRIHYGYILLVIALLVGAYFIGSEYQKTKQTQLHKLGLKYTEDTQNLKSKISEQNNEINNLYQTLSAIPLGPPVNDIIIGSKYGYRIDPFNDSISFHYGVDIKAEYKDEIYATANGIVTNAKWINGYGKCVMIQHAYNYSSVYAHLSKILVNKGDSITKNQLIGLAGSTGRSTHTHLHYEIHKQNKPLNPEEFINLKY
jgi:murein DD-endopeptidase MepM/ murein hydrolase activator NlpD